MPARTTQLRSHIATLSRTCPTRLTSPTRPTLPISYALSNFPLFPLSPPLSAFFTKNDTIFSIIHVKKFYLCIGYINPQWKSTGTLLNLTYRPITLKGIFYNN